MSMTGGKAYLLKSEVTNYGNGSDTTSLYLYVKESVSVKTNLSSVLLGLYITSKYNIGSWTDYNGSYLGLAKSGSNCKSFDGTIAKGSGTRWLVENVAFDVSHDSDGTKDMVVYWKWGVNSPWGQFENPSGSKSVPLTDIDRTAPTVSVSVSSITTNSFKISASASVKCNSWDYSIDGGENWKNFSTTDGTAASVTVTGLSVNTSYSVVVKARRTYNYVYGRSAKKSVKTLGHAIVQSCPNFNVDVSSVKLVPSVTVYESSYTHTITLIDGSTELVTISGVSWTAGTSGRTITLSTDQRDKLLASMTSVPEKDFTLRVRTYNSSTLIGSDTCTARAITTAKNSGPIFSEFSYKDVSSLVAITGDELLQVQGYSSLVITAEAATAKFGASIVKYTAAIGSKTVTSVTNSIVVGAVDSSGSLTLTVSAVDSRGYSTSVQATVSVLPYAKPKISSCTARREDGIGSVIQLKFFGTISKVEVEGVNRNTLQYVAYSTKPTDESEYGNATSIIDGVVLDDNGDSFSFETNQLTSLDTKKSFDILIEIRDSVEKATNSYVIPMGIPLLAARKRKLGINNPNPEYTLDVAGDINLTGEIFINGVKLSEVLGL